MDLQDFESCKYCKKIKGCKKPCQKFLNDKKMDEIDRKFWAGSERVDILRQLEGDKNTELFRILKEKMLKKIQLNQIIQCIAEDQGFKGRVVQKTDNFIAVIKEESKYVSIINFLDIYTKDVAIMAY